MPAFHHVDLSHEGDDVGQGSGDGGGGKKGRETAVPTTPFWRHFRRRVVGCVPNTFFGKSGIWKGMGTETLEHYNFNRM